ncbi:MAG: VOC family protein [Phormidesmis sp. CAN_BIN36]|nr:VOC family protein [Phormidesmis sp. CAN_BIN36]
MKEFQFRFGYFTPNYEATVAFYRDGLGLSILEKWDRNPDDRGTLLGAASGIIEVLALPHGQSDHLWDRRPPQGAFMAIEVEDVAALYDRVIEKGFLVQKELQDQEWGHRSFCVQEPNGLTLYFFSKTGGS